MKGLSCKERVSQLTIRRIEFEQPWTQTKPDQTKPNQAKAALAGRLSINQTQARKE
jgi:hypothetical protein